MSYKFFQPVVRRVGGTYVNVQRGGIMTFTRQAIRDLDITKYNYVKIGKNR